MLADEILSEIDATLDQLISNANTIKDVDTLDLLEEEIDGFYKTQECLLEHLLYMDEMLQNSSKTINSKSVKFQIQKKLIHFEKLKSPFKRKKTKIRRAL
jgi:hypothetical protein